MMGQNFEEVRESADILIVGGGIAGLTAAVSAKEKTRMQKSSLLKNRPQVMAEKQIKAAVCFSILILST